MFSKIKSPFDACYLWVQLKAEETWTYQPADQHDVAWTFAQSGILTVNGEQLMRELAVFEEGNGPLYFNASDNCAFLVASAAKSPHVLSLGYYSVHTTPEKLAAGEQRIKELEAAIKR